MADDGAAPRTADAVDLGPLGDSMGFLLRLAQLETFRDFFEAFAGRDVRPGEITVLMLIDINPGVRQGILAKALMIKRAHMTKMVRALEEAGLVSRSVPEDDRRSVELRLTPEGRRRLDAARDAFAAHEARNSATLTAREQAELKRLLRKLLSLSPPSETPCP